MAKSLKLLWAVRRTRRLASHVAIRTGNNVQRSTQIRRGSICTAKHPRRIRSGTSAIGLSETGLRVPPGVNETSFQLASVRVRSELVGNTSEGVVARFRLDERAARRVALQAPALDAADDGPARGDVV